MLSEKRLDSVYGAPWRLTAGFRTDLKIMVSPIRIRVPPLKKSCKQQAFLLTTAACVAYYYSHYHNLPSVSLALAAVKIGRFVAMFSFEDCPP